MRATFRWFESPCLMPKDAKLNEKFVIPAFEMWQGADKLMAKGGQKPAVSA
ncbi:hypothetical protein ACFO1V_06065 [Daeguia caeni]|uniref:Uncharacterized protein n=1 Tax=Daeguia caeni TaxID=439612 RepID=A0ABV9H6S5_9HYPH